MRVSRISDTTIDTIQIQLAVRRKKLVNVAVNIIIVGRDFRPRFLETSIRIIRLDSSQEDTGHTKESLLRMRKVIPRHLREVGESTISSQG